MMVEAFVPTWPGDKQHPAQIVDVIARHCPVSILDNPVHYFNAQWLEAKYRFLNHARFDILIWAMADISLPEKFSQMYDEAVRILAKGDVGWYAPDVAWTSYIYDRKELKQYEDGVYEVPNTDSVFFAILKDVVKKMPDIDPDICFMWGMDFTAIATARRMGLKCVRDYRFQVGHPDKTGYDIERASLEMKKLWAWNRGNDRNQLQDDIEQLITEANRLKKLPSERILEIEMPKQEPTTPGSRRIIDSPSRQILVEDWRIKRSGGGR